VAPSRPWGWELQELSLRMTGQNLFSGRHLFWDDLGAAISARPWFGYGAGATAEAITGYSWSSHNLYLQTALQTGVVGLGLLVFFLWTIWAQFRPGYTDIGARVAASFFAGVLVHQVFEVSLTQNNIATGFLAWIIVSIGLSRSKWDQR
jgi:O-antigen ligase